MTHFVIVEAITTDGVKCTFKCDVTEENKDILISKQIASCEKGKQLGVWKTYKVYSTVNA